MHRWIQGTVWWFCLPSWNFTMNITAYMYLETHRVAQKLTEYGKLRFDWSIQRSLGRPTQYNLVRCSYVKINIGILIRHRIFTYLDTWMGTDSILIRIWLTFQDNSVIQIMRLLVRKPNGSVQLSEAPLYTDFECPAKWGSTIYWLWVSSEVWLHCIPILVSNFRTC